MAEETDVPDPESSLLAFFGSELRRVRAEAGMSQGQVAKEAHSTQAMISYVELARRVPTAQLAADLDRVFHTGGHFQRLHPLVLRYAYPPWFLPFIQIEGDASGIRSFQTQVIHGLLQTESYARAMLTAVRPDNLEDLIAARMSRQAIFDRDDPPRAWFVIDEQVLRRRIGGPEVMRDQLQRLLTAGMDPRTVIQVLPERVAAHPGLAGPFTILTTPEVPDALYVDGFSQGRMGLDPAEVAVAVHAYDLLRAVSLSPDESAELIGGYLEGLR
ncbi:helix-turn-helix transcriptional regulator [Streptacidiphilus sp. PB12-B1b]|uniref:helix-turn-helix domain-containing protein n=1 Tax=Streptacidiphilus sp. PB12-B1b TaxID=2705012 RepID=UPI0015FD0FE9|nr:helix-turn-helix transcriptional regulator [Streptacidiphilus sp. PB12-B1b]QMU75787.1 helix-turn-helix transcriptional regulator [Streptacidiphilus sp. PB12-B1b]